MIVQSKIFIVSCGSGGNLVGGAAGRLDADGLLVRQELGTCFPIARLRISRIDKLTRNLVLICNVCSRDLDAPY